MGEEGEANIQTKLLLQPFSATEKLGLYKIHG